MSLSRADESKSLDGLSGAPKKMTNADKAPVRPSEVWSGREDLNLRHPAPKAGALPGCATPRSESILQQVANLCKGFRPMADAIFFLA
jgi:hypothetical protein